MLWDRLCDHHMLLLLCQIYCSGKGELFPSFVLCFKTEKGMEQTQPERTMYRTKIFTPDHVYDDPTDRFSRQFFAKKNENILFIILLFWGFETTTCWKLAIWNPCRKKQSLYIGTNININTPLESSSGKRISKQKNGGWIVVLSYFSRIFYPN